jgi:hypothetical protein
MRSRTGKRPIFNNNVSIVNIYLLFPTGCYANDQGRYAKGRSGDVFHLFEPQSLLGARQVT